MMLRSLFGDLYPLRDTSPAGRREPENDFEATAILEHDEPLGRADRNGLGAQIAEHPPADRSAHDLFITGSATQALRAQFAHQRDEQASGQRFITLHDPAGMWAGSVIKALADASGHPVERLHLRDQASLQTLALIERITLLRRDDDTLKIYHADVHAEGPDAATLPLALMERSDMSVVIAGPLSSQALDDLVHQLLQASASAAWRCPELLFLLPVGATYMADKIRLAAWPAGVHVHATTEPLTSASIVWNLLLGHWTRVKPVYPAGQPVQPMQMATGQPGLSSAPAAWSTADDEPAATTPWSGVETVSFAGRPPVATAEPPAIPAVRQPPSPARALAVLQELILLDGLIFAALVDANDGHVVASEGRGPDIDRAALASAEILRTHRNTLRQMGHWRPNDPVDEVLVTAGSRYHILRTLQAHPDHFILAVLDKLRSNLAITRFRIMEAQQVLN